MAGAGAPARNWRIGIGGMTTEGNTFAPLPTMLGDFETLRGPELLTRYPFMPDGVFPGWPEIAWLPALHADALPGGPVAAAAYTTLKREMLDRVRAMLPLDGFVLDLHGAMAVEGLDDAEADLAAALRDLVGPRCLISASMDLHGNVSARLVELVNLFTAYRHAPHTDMVETRQRAFANLLRCLDDGLRPARAWVRIPVALPGERTATTVEPGRSLYASLAEPNARADIVDASLWIGYAWADQPRTGGSVVVTGLDADAVRRDALALARRFWDARREFSLVAPAGDADWCIDQVLAAGVSPAFVSDAGDNVTAGATGDVPYLLGRLLARPEFVSGERTALYTNIPDPDAVEACAVAGVGRTIECSLGGKLDLAHGRPLWVRGTVLGVSSYAPRGGRTALLRAGGTTIAIASRRMAFTLRRDFADLGLDPANFDLTVVKLGYLFPELREIARAVYMALTPGASDLDVPRLPFRRICRPIFPLDPEMTCPEFEVRVIPD